jgi:hypothetical protein
MKTCNLHLSSFPVELRNKLKQRAQESGYTLSCFCQILLSYSMHKLESAVTVYPGEGLIWLRGRK